jgi:hypothetical protein
MTSLDKPQDRLGLLEAEIERRLAERFAALREEFDRLRLESDRRWAGFLSRFDQRLTGVVPAELLASAAGGSGGNGLAQAAEAARSLDGATSQAQVLDLFLQLCLRHASRAVLLILRDGSLGVWKAVGLARRDGDTEALRRVSFSAAEAGPVSRLMAGEGLRLSRDNHICGRLMCPDAADAILLPVVIREKVAGALYADAVAGEQMRLDPDSLGFLTFLAGLAIERLATRKLVPAPALQALRGPAAESRAASASGPYETHVVNLWRDVQGETPALAEPVPAAGAPVSGPRRLSGPLAPADGDQRRDDARRFAKLLVSEIKLYNGAAVEAGRARGNLYAMLKDDIDRSRQMYDNRIPQDIRAGRDFLYEELVAILADGKAEVLGL